MIIGISATRHGMNRAQLKWLWSVLSEHEGDLHHGDCLGGDTQAHDMATLLMGWTIIIHPPAETRYRAHRQAAVILTPKPSLDRNHDIVDASDVLIAVPQTHGEELRSGTWATIRYAAMVKKPIRIISPDGSVRREI